MTVTVQRFRVPLERFRNRPDSEHGQALVRLVIAALILTYLAWLGLADGFGDDNDRWVLLVMAAETLVGLLLVVGILRNPATSHPRRITGMFADYTTLTLLMSMEGQALAPLYVIVLWVTVGNGLRYGQRYLFAAVAMALVSFAIVITTDAYWRAQPALAWGLWVGLVAIPGYLISLLRDLHRVSEEARRANEAKSRFLANMSHEFRSPLNGIIGMAELMHTTRMTPEQRECADVIQTSAQTLLLLVEDVLDISAIEAGKLERRDSDFNVRELVRRLRTMLQPHAAGKGLSFGIDVDAAVPSQLHGDMGQLTQVLLNLLHNAVKFTETGRVGLDVQRLDDRDGKIVLCFTITDTGIGIPAEARERIFQPFEQVDNGPTRRYGGTGLGTTIARTLVGLLEGTLELDDNPGGGSRFRVTVPFAPSQAPLVVTGEAAVDGDKIIAFDDPFVRHRARVRPLKLLVADDLQANRVVLGRILERAGHTVVMAADGEEALDCLEDEGVDAAIVDMHMPGLSGLDVVRQLRVMQAGTARRTPMLMLSADATLEAVREAEAAGVHAFLTKPVVVARVLEALADAVAEHEPNAARVPLAEPALGGVNVEVLEELAGMGLGVAFLRDFVEQCLRDASQCMSVLERAGAGSDWEAAREGAHALKGVAENLGAQQVAVQAEAVMRCSDTVLERDWRQRLAALDAAMLGAAGSVRREVGRLVAETGAPKPGPGSGTEHAD